MRTSEGGYPSPITSRKTDTGTRAYPRLRRRIDCHRPTIHGLLRRGTVHNESNRLQMPRQSHQRVAFATASGSNPAEHSPNASPVATALVAVSVGEGQSFGIAGVGREGIDELNEPTRYIADTLAPLPPLHHPPRQPPPGLDSSPKAARYKLKRGRCGNGGSVRLSPWY